MATDKTTIGSYVTAKLVNVDDCRQGVHIGFDEDGNALVIGETEPSPYVCEPHVSIVPDSNIILDSTRAHIAAVRSALQEIG